MKIAYILIFALACISHRQSFLPLQVTVAAPFESTSASALLLQYAIPVHPVTSRNVRVCSNGAHADARAMRNPG